MNLYDTHIILPSFSPTASLSSSLLTAGRSGQIKEGYVILHVSTKVIRVIYNWCMY